MAKTSLIISSTDSSTGKKLQKTLTDINSSATNAQLKSFAQALNNLTTNTYSESNRVDRINCDTEESASGGGGGSVLTKAFRELAITGTTRGATATATFNATTSVTNNPVVFFITPSGNSYTATYIDVTAGATTGTQRTATFTVPTSGGYLYAGFRENDAFYADFVMAEVS